MDEVSAGPHRVKNEEVIGESSMGSDEDILSLIKPGGPSPGYDLDQKFARTALAKVSNRLLAFVDPPGTGKTWTYISLLSELLHENKFRVVIVAPTDRVLDNVAVRIHEVFQQHPSLKNKIICHVKSQDLAAKSSHVTCAQLFKIINSVAKEPGHVVHDKDILQQVAFDARIVEC